MLKIGIIGLGDIARKAYLPVISQINGVEFHLCTRNQEMLVTLGEKYRFSHLHHTIDSLIQSGIKGAFIHSATESHEEIIETLLLNDIHVYVDKPITYHYETSKRLVALAKERNLILMVGFNRRYAPSIKTVKENHAQQEPNMVIIEKNRPNHPDIIRRFIFDDFIHVIDTVRYLFPHPIDNIIINGRMKENLLHHVVVQFIAKEGTAIAIMNRDSGVSEEKIEMMNSSEKYTIYNVADTAIQKGKTATSLGGNDWEPTLHKRGFEAMIYDFLEAVQNNQEPMITMDDALQTHEICEMIVRELEK